MTKKSNPKNNKKMSKSNNDKPKKNIVLFVIKNKNEINDKNTKDEKKNENKDEKKNIDEKKDDKDDKDLVDKIDYDKIFDDDYDKDSNSFNYNEYENDDDQSSNEEKFSEDYDLNEEIFDPENNNFEYNDHNQDYEDEQDYDEDDEDYDDEDYDDKDYDDEDDEDYDDEDDEDYDDEDDEDYDDEEDDYEESKEYEEGEIDEEEEEDQNKDDKNNKKSNADKVRKRNRDDRSLDNLFSIIINGGRPSEKRPSLFDKRPDLGELNSKRSNKKQKKESFYDYFKEAKELLPINKKIENLKDLIELGETYDKKDKNRYVINMKALNKCIKPLKELDKFIGMKKIKEMVMDLIFMRLQNFEDNLENEMWHLVVQGSPGCGKTEVSRVIGKLYYGLGIVDKDEFTQVKRSQMIGKWCGHTAAQTQEIFDNAEGGVLFIDEAYSLGNPDQKDAFTKECIDTINQNLTEKKRTVVIIAGYKEQLDSSFFSYNPGLSRRFKMRLSIDNYSFDELRKIFLKKLYESGWEILDKNEDEEIPLKFFEKNKDLFKFNGGDMENLWSLVKMVHCRRVFGKESKLHKKVTKEDLKNALDKYKENDEVKQRDNDIHFKNQMMNSIYC